MSHIHFIGGEKGGVGKSLVSRLLAQYFIDHQMPFLGFDTDRSHGALLRFYGDFAAPATLDAHDSLDRVVEAAAEDPQRRVLVDLAAQTSASLGQWFEDAGVLELAGSLGLGVTYWHVMDSGKDSVDLLSAWLDRFGGQMPLVLVQNEVRGSGFELLGSSGQRERALSFGAKQLTIPKLPDATMQKIDGTSASFWAAVNSSERAATGLGLLDRQRVKVWLNRVYTGIDSVGV